MSYFKTRVLLVDELGFVWVDSELSATQILKLKKAYSEAGITLSSKLPKGDKTE